MRQRKTLHLCARSTHGLTEMKVICVFKTRKASITYPESLSLLVSTGFKDRRWDGVSGPLPVLRVSLMGIARNDTCLIPALLSSLHCNEQYRLTSWRCLEQIVHWDAPTAPLGGLGCGRRRRKRTFDPFITYDWIPEISARRETSATLTTSWYELRRTYNK